MQCERFGSMILEVQEKFATRTLVIALGLSAAFDLALAQQNQPDLTGAISFDVHSGSGRVETLAVTIGDGGTGPYKAILSGDPSLPTHAIYRPRDLRPFGDSNLLPIVAFANGGCRNGSGEFRNFLSDLASHGYIVVALGPAGEALVAGSEGRVGQTQPSQLLDGVEWAIQRNSLQGSDFYRKIDTSKVAVMGQSCGGSQARSVSTDPRVTTTVMLNSGGVPGTPRPAPAQNPPATNLSAALNRGAKRYAPHGSDLPDPGGAMAASSGSAAVTFHAPVAFINGGPRDLAYQGALTAFEGIGAADRRRVVRHLLSGCRPCRRLASEESRAARNVAHGYDAVFDNLAVTARMLPRELAAERLCAREQWAYLRSLSPAQRLLRVENDPRFLTFGLYERLLDVSKEMIGEFPPGAVEVASLALTISERLDTKLYGRGAVPHSRAAAFAALGNAERSSSDFEQAGSSLAEAERILVEEGVDDALELAQIYSLNASLETDVGNFELAVKAIDEEQKIYKKIDDRHLIGRGRDQAGDGCWSYQSSAWNRAALQSSHAGRHLEGTASSTRDSAHDGGFPL